MCGAGAGGSAAAAWVAEQGDDSQLKAFLDEFFDAGLIPFALIRWEVTGLDDEIRRLW